MRKRIVPALLALVLVLSMTPIAFAASSKTVTLLQETTGNLNKEFEYYISKSSVSNISGPKVETINNVVFYTCRCGFTINSAIPNCGTIWTAHDKPTPFGCGKGYDYKIGDCYKITLKNGEKVTINPKHDTLLITTTQDSQYQILYSTDGNNFTNYVDDVSVVESDKAIARIRFTPTENGTLTIRRSDGSASDYTPPAASGTSFPDVSPSAAYSTAVEYVNKLGIMVGDEKGNFNPDKIVNRAEMATIVCRVLGQAENLPTLNVFTDVPTAHWGNACIGRASELKIVNGYGDGTFGPSDPVTYEQAITMIVRAIGEEDAANYYGGYPDGHLYVADGKNLLKGIPPMKGQGLARSSVAVLLYNYYTAASGVAHTHSWATRHIDEVGHYESSGTHKVTYYTCSCGFYLNSDDPNWKTLWQEHKKPITGCKGAYEYIVKDVPNDSQYIVDTPAHDETYCTICGATK